MKEKLNILWTSPDAQTAEHMVLLYGPKSFQNNLWDEVQIIIWGGSAKLVATNEHIQSLVSQAMKNGVKFSGCSTCAEGLNATQKLLEIGVELKPWGKPLSEIIKNKENLITI